MSFRAELEENLRTMFIKSGVKLTGIGWRAAEENIQETLTSIINLVDKGLPEKKKWFGDSRESTPEEQHAFKVISEAENRGYNAAIDDMRAIIRGSDDKGGNRQTIIKASKTILRGESNG